MKAVKLNAYMETARFPVSLSCSPEIFVPDDLCSISYNINKKYEYTKKGFRKFNKVRCRYIDKDAKIFCNLFDNDNPVFFV